MNDGPPAGAGEEARVNLPVRETRNQRGVALPLALFALVMLSGLLLAFLTMAGMEPEIAANLGDVTRARFVAEAGVEWAFDQLVVNPNWSAVLATNNGLMTTGQALPGLTPAFGTFAAQIRNDNQAGDPALTGQPIDGGSATTDTNGAVVLTASGTYRGVTRQIQVVLRRVNLPPFPGAYSMPGVQADLWFQNANFDIDGRDWKCTANCDDPNPANRTYALNPDQSKMKYGIATQTGTQQNISGGTTTYEQRAEVRLDTAGKQSNVRGKDQTNPAASTTGLNTVAPDAGLNPAVMQNFLTQLAQFSGTTVLQSTIPCPMVLSGNAADSSRPQLTNGCGTNQSLDLGSRDNPKLVYFRGQLHPTSSFTGVRMTGTPIRGAGIFIVEDGDLRVTNQLDWDGVVIVTGQYVSSIFESGSRATVYGATVSNETVWNEGGAQTTYWDGYFTSSNTVRLRHSQEALDLVQRALLFRMSTWREL